MMPKTTWCRLHVIHRPIRLSTRLTSHLDQSSNPCVLAVNLLVRHELKEFVEALIHHLDIAADLL